MNLAKNNVKKDFYKAFLWLLTFCEKERDEKCGKKSFE